MNVTDLITDHEGEKLKPYTDTRGKTTIGRGRNLTDKGISEEESLMLFQADYTEALNWALKYPWYNNLNEPRQAVIVDMIFELGAEGFAKFTRFHHKISLADWHGASLEMLNSAWAAEVPNRAADDANIIDSGEWPDR